MEPQTFTTTTGPLLFHLTRVSSNRKTGPIPVSTSSAKTCPPTCPLAANGCYANGGPMALHWREVTNGNRGVVWADFLEAIRNLPKGQLWRHNAAGDLWKPGTVIGSAALTQLVEANRGRRGFTYSHHPRTPSTFALLNLPRPTGSPSTPAATVKRKRTQPWPMACGPL